MSTGTKAAQTCTQVGRCRKRAPAATAAAATAAAARSLLPGEWVFLRRAIVRHLERHFGDPRHYLQSRKQQRSGRMVRPAVSNPAASLQAQAASRVRSVGGWLPRDARCGQSSAAQRPALGPPPTLTGLPPDLSPSLRPHPHTLRLMASLQRTASSRWSKRTMPHCTQPQSGMVHRSQFQPLIAVS